MSLGDVSSAFFSTGIPNIETYMRATLPVWGAGHRQSVLGLVAVHPALAGVLEGAD